MSPLSDVGSGSSPRLRRASLRESVRRAFISGLALTIPALITLIVLTFALNFVASLLGPVAGVVNYVLPGRDVAAVVLQLAALLTLLVVIFLVGVISERTSGDRFADEFHSFMEAIPGIGSVYTSFNEMSELLLDSDTDSFQDVKLVEYPTDDSYAVAFLTAESPEAVTEATGHDEMETLFMPMAPNPVMGGFVVHVAADRVHDVDLTVEEGIRSIVTSGVATGAESGPGVPGDDLGDQGAFDQSAPPAPDAVGRRDGWTRYADHHGAASNGEEDGS
ncbi:MAG: DUF502 domain-containing protein [Haloarculaceae archaeon]